jgi:uncharacterized Tic20 family protein
MHLFHLTTSTLFRKLTGMNPQLKITLTSIANFLPGALSIPPVFISLICWVLWRNDEDAVVADYTRRRLNTSISWAIYFMLAILSVYVLIGLLLLPTVFICWLVFCILDLIRASQGDTSYRFPGTIEFIK